MFEQRTCRHCEGLEFKVMTAVSMHGWRTGTIDGDRWFCSACDWGSDVSNGEDPES